MLRGIDSNPTADFGQDRLISPLRDDSKYMTKQILAVSVSYVLQTVMSPPKLSVSSEKAPKITPRM